MVLDGIGTYFSLYTTFPWYDIPMHVMGGAWVALMVLALTFSPLRKPARSPTFFDTILVALVGFVIIGGILWEGYEAIVSLLISHDPFDVVDTLADIGNGFIGAFCAALIFFACVKK